MMDNNEILVRLNRIFNDVLEPDELIRLELSSTAEDIEDWDSLAHIRIIVAVENDFSIQFTAMELENFNSVEDLLLAVKSKV